MTRPESPGFNPDADPNRIMDLEIDAVRKALSQTPPRPLPDTDAVQAAVQAGKLEPDPMVVAAITAWVAEKRGGSTDL